MKSSATIQEDDDENGVNSLVSLLNENLERGLCY
jgi:hypothetical protein